MILPRELSASASETPPAAGDAASEAGADAGADAGAATDGAVVAPPPLEQAAAMPAIATTVGRTRERRRSRVIRSSPVRGVSTIDYVVPHRVGFRALPSVHGTSQQFARRSPYTGHRFATHPRFSTLLRRNGDP